jgi:acetyl-CoA carboxylase biotin carboxylase subunit
MLRSLRELRVEGIKTTASFHQRVLQSDTFRSGLVDTKWVERELLG